MTPVHLAAMHVHSLYIHLSIYPSIYQSIDLSIYLFQPGMTPVHLAAMHGHSGVVSEFVKEKVTLS